MRSYGWRRGDRYIKVVQVVQVVVQRAFMKLFWWTQ